MKMSKEIVRDKQAEHCIRIVIASFEKQPHILPFRYCIVRAQFTEDSLLKFVFIKALGN